MIKNIFLALIMTNFIIFNSSVAAEETLTAEQITRLFSDKTFDVHNETKNIDARIYSAADGNFIIVYDSGKKKQRYWRVDNRGRHCVFRKKNLPGRCSTVISIKNGVYKKITMGLHSHTLKNFVDGDQL